MSARTTSGPAVLPSRGLKLTVSFGMVNVAVRYAPLVKSAAGRVKGRVVCSEHLVPSKGQPICPEGDHVCETTTAYEVGGVFVTIDKDALAKSSTKRLELDAMVDAEAIDPLYFETPYEVWPEAGHEQSFDLLCAVLAHSGKYAVGTTVLSNATRAIVLRWSPAAGCLLAHTLIYDEKIAWNELAGISATFAERPGVNAKALAMAETLFASIEEDGYALAGVVDEYDLLLREAIAAAAAGAPAPARVAEVEALPVVDLMAALEASVAAVESAKVTA